MEKKEDSTEGKSSSTESPDVRAFFDLLDREGHRLELLNKRKDTSSDELLAKNSVTWQPKFEVEDFKMSCETTHSNSAKACTTMDDGRSGRGIKRRSDLTALSITEDKIHRKNDGRRVEFDLNKTVDSPKGSN